MSEQQRMQHLPAPFPAVAAMTAFVADRLTLKVLRFGSGRPPAPPPRPARLSFRRGINILAGRVFLPFFNKML